MKTWKLILFLAAILITPASRGANLTFNQIQQDCGTYLDSTGVGHETYSTNIGSMQSSFQQSDANANISSGINSVITLSGNVLSISGNGQCSYAENSQDGFATFSTVSVLFTISSTFYYSIQAQVIDPGPNYNGSTVYVSNYGGGGYIVDFGYPSSTLFSGGQSGILSPGEYNVTFGSVINTSYPGLVLPPTEHISWQAIFTVSPSNIVSTTVGGHITDAHSGLPITNATVQIGPLSVLSDPNGYYSQSNLPAATYTVTASANNYVSLTNTVTTSSSQTNVTQNFVLSPLPKLDYFGVGVNWANVTSPAGLNHVRGDISATNLYNHLFLDLPSIFNLDASMIVPLDATATSIGNSNIITAQFNQFIKNVYTNDTVVFYISTHAGNDPINGTPSIELSLASDFVNYRVCNANYITSLLKSLPPTTRKIVILDCCYAMGIAYQLVDDVNNISVLAASTTNNEIVLNGIFYGGENLANNDGTGVFTDSLISNLDNGIFDLHTISANITTDQGNVYAYDIGQVLYLEDSGTGIFTGLQPQLYESSAFTGNLASNTVSVVQPPPNFSQATVVTNSFLMTLTNVPSSGSIAIEVSKNLNSWMQVAFSPAAGTNLSYSFSVTNAPCQFFRTIVVP